MSTSLDLIKKIIREGKGETFTKGLLAAMTELNHIKPQSLGGLLSRCVREDKYIQRCKQRVPGHLRDEYVYWYDENEVNAEYRKKPRKRKPLTAAPAQPSAPTSYVATLNLAVAGRELILDRASAEAIYQALGQWLYPGT